MAGLRGGAHCDHFTARPGPERWAVPLSGHGRAHFSCQNPSPGRAHAWWSPETHPCGGRQVSGTLFPRCSGPSGAVLAHVGRNCLFAWNSPRAGPGGHQVGLRRGAQRDQISSEENPFQTVSGYRSRHRNATSSGAVCRSLGYNTRGAPPPPSPYNTNRISSAPRTGLGPGLET